MYESRPTANGAAVGAGAGEESQEDQHSTSLPSSVPGGKGVSTEPEGDREVGWVYTGAGGERGGRGVGVNGAAVGAGAGEDQSQGDQHSTSLPSSVPGGRGVSTGTSGERGEWEVGVGERAMVGAGRGRGRSLREISTVHHSRPLYPVGEG